MNMSRMVICSVVACSFVTAVSGQRVSVASPVIPSSPTEYALPDSNPTPRLITPTFTVMVFNFRQVPPAVLSNAEIEAEQIFGHVGMKIVWQECSTGNEPCLIPPGTVCFLSIRGGGRVHGKLMELSGRGIPDHIAVVYYDAVRRVARQDTAPQRLSTLLANVIAHELGHLLLGLHEHSTHGMMSDRWNLEQNTLALISDLDFLPEEGKLMRSVLLGSTQTGEAAQPTLVSTH